MTAATHQDHDLADSKTASRIFFAGPPTARPVLPSQVTETHLESVTYVYRNAPGCVVAPNNTPGLGTRIMNGVQTGLDVVGLIPGAGEIADGANALISLGRGDYAGAALSGAAMIPFAGWGATGAKIIRRADDVIDAATPVGRLGSPLGTVARNTPTSISGRQYSGHALDQMQARGLTPSVVENTIQNGTRSVGNTASEIVHFDPVNNVTVVTDKASGRVVTTYGGGG